MKAQRRPCDALCGVMATSDMTLVRLNYCGLKPIQRCNPARIYESCVDFAGVYFDIPGQKSSVLGDASCTKSCESCAMWY